MSRNTTVSTDCMVPLTEWTKNDRWIADRMLFLMSLQDFAPNMFYSAEGSTIEEILDNYQNSFSRELMDLELKYPKHFRFANHMRVETWFPHKEELSGDTGIC